MLLLDFHLKTLSIWLIFMWCFIFPAPKKMFLGVLVHYLCATPLQVCLKKKEENNLAG